MKVIISPSKVTGTIQAPASKSAMQRACAAALLRRGTSILHHPGHSDDEKAALSIIEQLGAIVEKQDKSFNIRSNGIYPKSEHIHCGESGLSVRMFTPIAALHHHSISIEGHGSLTKRPLKLFDEVLPSFGVAVQSNEGFLPIKVRGPLKPQNIEIDGSLSSQFLTGLLMAYAGAEAKDVTISVKNLASRPYIDLTLQVMQDFGLKTPVNNGYETFYFNDQDPSVQPQDILHYNIESDWSGGAFLLVAGAINGDLEVKGLDVFSTQADKAILQALMQAGSIMSVEQDKISIRKNKLQAFHFNATDCPDLFPPLVALAAHCEGTTVIEGVHRLTHKESNRALTLQKEFGEMGVIINLQDDLMIIKGSSVKSALVSSHGDHRIAMACAIAALGGEGPVTIEGPEAVNKSYPDFWNDLIHLQVHLQSVHQ
ncbi:MAG TPA: 3-phosphoshikimate 1-carboxyvinyltransferase [Flavisolibacter sp.]|nr:3-phosphoshikimate 1-carboxyvinyltransferase [Flavisolibacter sp.]